MEIISIPVSGVPQFTTPLIKTASTDPAPVPVPQPAPQVQFPVADATDTTDATAYVNPTQQDADAARQAALSFKNFYAISDTASATFRDVNGNYITRSVNLRDGTVTYSPKPQYVKSAETGGISIDA